MADYNLYDKEKTQLELNKKVDIAMEGQLMLDIMRPVGSYFVQYGSTDNPNTLFNDTTSGITSTWVEEVMDAQYLQFNSSMNAGTAVSEELPNVKGVFNSRENETALDNGGIPTYNNNAKSNGAIKHESYASNYTGFSYYGGRTVYELNIDLSKGQTNSDGTTYKSDSCYKDGGAVHPKGFTVKLWRRTA